MIALGPKDQMSDTGDWRVKMSERVRVATQSMGVGLWEWNLVLRTFVWDRRTYELFGVPPSEEKLDLSVIFRAVHPQDRMQLAEALQRSSTGVAELDIKFRIPLENGKARHLHALAEVVDDGRGYPIRLVGTLRDVTASQKMSEALGEERERLQVTLMSIGDAVIATDHAGFVTFINPPAAAMTGWTREEAAGKPLAEVLNLTGIDPAAQSVLDAAQICLDSDETPRVQHRARLVSRTGETYEIENTVSRIRTALGATLGAVLVLRDTTEAQAFQRKLEYAATHDALTGLANRTLFEQRLEACAELPSAVGHVVCFIDVDRFKVINDSAGHAAGDSFLKMMVEVMSPFLSEGHTLARLGGDEFGLLMQDTAMTCAERITNDMIRATKDYRFSWNQRVYSASISVGLAPVVAGRPPGELLSQADAACYAAKNAGRGRSVQFKAGEGEAAKLRAEVVVAADMRQVMEENRLVLYAQEIVATDPAKRGRQHYEVLIRMLDRQYNIISPSAFIPAAERFSMMDEVDHWILREAIQNMGRRIAQVGNMEISLNLSANSLDNPSLLQFVTDLLEDSPLPASAITFEITESAALSQVNTASRVMSGLKELGCRVALDDFGTGSSSLSYLKHFPVDVVKLDGSFISNMLTSEIDFAIVRSINDLAHRIGAKTVAEFVEDEATLAAVTSIGVDYIQGYIFGKPRPLDQILKAATRPVAVGL